MKAKGKKKPISKEIAPTTDVFIPHATDAAFASGGDYAGIGNPMRVRSGDVRFSKGLNHFQNIRQGISPLIYGDQTVSVADALFLCQMAYWNVPIFKNTIDVMAEFSNSEIHWEGGNQASREFHSALWNKIGLWKLGDQFFREYYRGGNVVLFRFDGSITREDALKLSQVYPNDITASGPLRLPIRYVLLNPVDIRAGANVAFTLANQYYKVLNPYELSRLRFPSTDAEKELFDSLTKDQKTAVKQGLAPLIPLDPARLFVSFYKKQDYEPLAVPMGYCVLDDINMKLELKKMDRVILRTVESTILLVTMGNEPDKGGINPKAIDAMKEIFKSETVGRVLVADYTTKVSFVIPELSKVLGPEKYQVINDDIQNGLNNIFWGEQKFANAMVKIKVFVERLNDGRQAFINNFLLPEVQRISKLLGFKDYPTPVFKDVDLQDDVLVATMLTRLGELGILTPEETIDAIKTGRLPGKDEMQDHQQSNFDNRQQGMYSPITGPMPKSYDQQKQEVQDQNDQEQSLKKMEKPDVHYHASPATMPQKASQPAGRPKGTKKKQATKRVRPQGSSKATRFAMEGVNAMVIATDKVVKAVETALKKKYKIKKLNDQQSDAAIDRALSICENEPQEAWLDKVDAYLDSEQPLNHEALAAIDEIAHEHQCSRYLAVLLYHSQVEVEDDGEQPDQD